MKEALSKPQGHPKQQLFIEFLTEIGELSEGYHDPLGEFYMMHISYGRLGQYFTPEHICDMMAAIQIGTDLKDKQTVCDPTCGSGRMLLSVAKINRNALLYGAELDAVCCKMTVLNMLLNSLTGEVAQMDTLSNEFYRGYKVQTKLVGGQHYPYFVEFTNPDDSYLWLRPQPKQEAQQTAGKSKVAKPATPIFVQGDLFGQV